MYNMSKYKKLHIEKPNVNCFIRDSSKWFDIYSREFHRRKLEDTLCRILWITHYALMAVFNYLIGRFYYLIESWLTRTPWKCLLSLQDIESPKIPWRKFLYEPFWRPGAKYSSRTTFFREFWWIMYLQVWKNIFLMFPSTWVTGNILNEIFPGSLLKLFLNIKKTDRK